MVVGWKLEILKYFFNKIFKISLFIKGNIRLVVVSAPEVHNHPVSEEIAYIARMRLVQDIRDLMRSTPITEQRLGRLHCESSFNYQ